MSSSQIIFAVSAALFIQFIIAILMYRNLKSKIMKKYHPDTMETENIEDVVIALARTIDARDRYTEGHTERVSQYAVFLGERLGLDSKTLNKIRIGALIHDLGKIGTCSEILNKPGPLSPEERLHINKHPELGEQICKPLKAFEEIRDIIRHHHEKLDGSGYPDQLKGEDISLAVRIVTIADIFDALTSDRPYRQALSPEKAAKILFEEASKNKLDKKLVEEFILMLNDMGVIEQVGR